MSERSDWLERRRQGLGGSDVAAVLGLSAWASPYSLWAEKVGLVPLDDETLSDDMEFGRRSEQMNAEWFMDRTGLYVSGEQTECSSPGAPWMKCTIDGFVFEHPVLADLDGALGVFEAKKTADSPKAWEDKVPDAYACQATWNMLVTGHDHCWFGVLHVPFGRVAYRVYEFVLDPADAAFVLEACTCFWFDHVVAGIPPAVDATEATTTALRESWEPDPELCVPATGELRTALARIQANKARIKECETVVAANENIIRAALGAATTLTDGVDDKGRARVLATWAEQERTGIDTKALRAAEPDLATKYTTTTSSRILRIKTPKGTP